MLMLGLSKVAAFLMGKAAIPALILGCLVLGGNVLAARRDSLVKLGENKCEAKWEAHLLRQQRDVAIADARALQAQVNATDVLNTELKYNAADLEQKYAKLRASLVDADQRCLSDGVRELVGRVPAGGGSPVGPPAKGRQQR